MYFCTCNVDQYNVCCRDVVAGVEAGIQWRCLQLLCRPVQLPGRYRSRPVHHIVHPPLPHSYEGGVDFAGVYCLCDGWEMSPRTTTFCSHTFPGLPGSWIVCCLHLKIDYRPCARGWGRKWCNIFHYHWWITLI